MRLLKTYLGEQKYVRNKKGYNQRHRKYFKKCKRRLHVMVLQQI